MAASANLKSLALFLGADTSEPFYGRDGRRKLVVRRSRLNLI